MNFWDALKQSLIISGIIALALLGSIVYLAVTGQEIPSILAEGFTLVLGFYFGSKITSTGYTRGS